ncbi:hypothetical protein AB6A40_008943 [Gnathostoma spinigerum]|uniref:Uncharacterized protein n=1 Tax=Gnathostoma spinigerum TaxID=75299 RepID=A0ABD6EYA8_9BILA
MVDTGIQQNVCPSMDDSMAVVMAYLPTTLGDENENEFSQAIHEILKETFNISPADVKSVSKMASGNTPVLKANPGFGMNCKIVFRSCDLLSRVIAEKSKLVAPTTIHTLDEVTSHLEGMNVHQQHQYQHQEHHDDPEAARVEEGGTGDAGVSPQSVHTAADSLLLSPTISSELYRVQPSLSSGESVMTSTNEAVDCAARESRHCQDSAITTAMGCDGSARNHDSLTTNTTICSAQPTSEDMNKHKECVGDGDSERSDTLGEKEEVLEESAGRDSGNDDKVGLEKNNEANENKESFTKVLDDWRNWPIDKEGAPLFEFRKCAGQNEKRSIMIDNALPSDLYNPWIHAATQRARQIDTCFMQLYALESTKNGYGRILLSFSDDTAVMSAVINNLIHVRTHNCRRLRVFLPLTKGTMKQRQEIEKRQGHLREFPFSMRQLILKPLRDDVTEEHIRNEAFRDHEIEAVEFKQDLLGQRCALLTFKSASRAVLAHCANNYVPFGDTKNGDKWIRVLSCYVAIKESSTAASHDGLLTRNELKTYVEKKKDERFKGVKVDGAANGVHDGDHEDAGKARNIEPAASSLTSSGSDKVKGEVGADKAREEKSRIDRSVKKSSMRWNGSRRSTDAMRAESISGKRKRA